MEFAKCGNVSRFSDARRDFARISFGRFGAYLREKPSSIRAAESLEEKEKFVRIIIALRLLRRAVAKSRGCRRIVPNRSIEIPEAEATFLPLPPTPRGKLSQKPGKANRGKFRFPRALTFRVKPPR